MALDPLLEVLNILEDNWNSLNTDSLTPKFIKITDQKRIDFNESTDWVIAQRSLPNVQPAGVGPSNKHEIEKFNLDIRTLGYDKEEHYLNVIEEVKRILQANKINPVLTSNIPTSVLEFNGIHQDLSNQTYNLWRKLIPVQLELYNISR